MRKLSPVLAAVFLSVAALGLPPAAGAEEMRIAAVVNDEVITQQELNQAFLPVYLQMQSMYGPEEVAKKSQELKRQVLDQLIEERLMLQEARNPQPVEFGKGKVGTPSAVTVSEEEIDEMMADARARFESDEEMGAALEDQGLTREDLRSRFRDQIMIQKVISRHIRSRITVSPAEVTVYYGSHPDEFELPPAVQSAVILIKPGGPADAAAREKAQHLHAQLRQGADFYELARRYSDGPNAKMGGRIGYLEKGKSHKEIDQALFALKEGEISPVIKTAAGYHIFRAESIRPARRAALEEVKDEIHRRLFQEKTAARYKEWIARLRAGAYISVK